jgi:hypothetical protein
MTSRERSWVPCGDEVEKRETLQTERELNVGIQGTDHMEQKKFAKILMIMLASQWLCNERLKVVLFKSQSPGILAWVLQEADRVHLRNT